MTSWAYRKLRDPETREASSFNNRVKQLKASQDLRIFADLISGLFEDGRWTFVCSEHRPGRFLDEAEVTHHFLSREGPHCHVAIASTKVK